MKPRHRVKVLVLENDPFEIDHICASLDVDHMPVHFDIEVITDLKSFLNRIKWGTSPDVLLLDIDLGQDARGTGLDALREARATFPRVTIIMRSQSDDAQIIGTCLRIGADDYVVKSSDGTNLGQRIIMAHDLVELGKADPESVAHLPNHAFAFAGRTMKNVARQASQIIASAIRSIFIHGETGVGKEVVAEAFASQLPAKVPFLRINCGAIATDLVESELFGHVKGAFTGALCDKRGILEQASGGFVFLDEVATLSMKTQIALLRVVENQEVTPVGSDRPRKIDVRFISATNESIEDLIARGSFRLDLWHRLNERRFEILPLRDRRDEIPELIAYFCQTMAGGPYQATPAAIRLLSAIAWREGNVRELRNCLRSMTELHRDRWLTPQMIPDHVLRSFQDVSEPLPASVPSPTAGSPSKDGEYGVLETKFSPPMHPDNVTLTLRSLPKFPNSFEDLGDALFCELLNELVSQNRRWSLKDLAPRFGLSKSALSRRIARLIQSGRLQYGIVARHLALRTPCLDNKLLETMQLADGCIIE